MKKQLKKFKFDFDTTGLADFANEQKNPELLTEAVFTGRTSLDVDTQAGVVWKDVLNYLETDVFFQDGDGCGYTASGDVRNPQKEIETKPIKINMEFCPDKLRKKWNSIYLDAGSYQENMPFEEAFTQHMSEKVSEQVEIMLWQSDISTGAGNLQWFDGFLTTIDAGSPIDGNAAVGGWTPINSGTGITAGNVQSIFMNMWKRIPAKLEGKQLVFMCGWDTFKKLIDALMAINNNFYNGVDGNAYLTGELVLPGTGLRVIAYHGLTSTNRIFLTQLDNLVIGTDLENDFERFRIWYQEKEELIYFKLRAKLGTQVRFDDEIIEFTLT
jgi:hypothetical protein